MTALALCLIYQQFHLDEPWDSPHNITLLAQMPKIYACPSDPLAKPGTTPYQVVVGPRTIFTGGKPVAIREISDGTSNTILVGETTSPVPWSAPEDLPMDASVMASGFASRHPGGFNVLFADGSVRFLKSSLNPAIFSQLLTRDGNEVISGGSY